MKYDAMYFLKKFDAIPESKWTTGVFKDERGRKCALGHCGSQNEELGREGRALISLFNRINESAVAINDFDGIEGVDTHKFLGDTPKERVMNVLLLINAGVKL